MDQTDEPWTLLNPTNERLAPDETTNPQDSLVVVTARGLGNICWNAGAWVATTTARPIARAVLTGGLVYTGWYQAAVIAWLLL